MFYCTWRAFIKNNQKGAVEFMAIPIFWTVDLLVSTKCTAIVITIYIQLQTFINLKHGLISFFEYVEEDFLSGLIFTFWHVGNQLFTAGYCQNIDHVLQPKALALLYKKSCNTWKNRILLLRQWKKKKGHSLHSGSLCQLGQVRKKD